jgi:hypothetical protein
MADLTSSAAFRTMPCLRCSPLCQTSCRALRTAERGGADNREWHDTDKHSGTASRAAFPPEGAAVEAVSREVGVSVATLERWRAQALAAPGELTNT